MFEGWVASHRPLLRKSRPEYMSSCRAFSALLMTLRRPCTRTSTAGGGGWKAEAAAVTSSAISLGGSATSTNLRKYSDNATRAAKAKKTRPDRRLSTAVSSAGRAESLVSQRRIIITVHRTFVSGCEGPSISELRNVLVV